MKPLDSIAAIAGGLTVFWVLCAYAYLYGVFFRFDPSFIGVIPFSEAISSSFGKTAIGVVGLTPLV